MQMGSMQEAIALLTAAPAGRRQALITQAYAATKGRRWVPNAGPQTAAYLSEADELLYGGEPGGGKTDLGIGLSLTEHKRSLVLRRTNKEAEKLPDRYEQILGNTDGYNGQKGVWRIEGRIIDMGGCQNENDKQKRKGIPHDLKFFDELPDFSKSQYLFIINWTRSTDPNQRCRVVATANPPTNPQGVWVIERWAPWLDPRHPKPAASGELRWYLQVERDREEEVDGPGPYEVMIGGLPKMVRARSRTFVRSTLDDNPDLSQTDYASTLASAAGDLHDLATGDFEAGLKDRPFQAIPTDWVRAAQERWTEKPPPGIPMCGIGVDASGGGNDPMVIAMRHDGWYAAPVIIPGKDIPAARAGKHGAGLVISYRRNNAAVVVDMGGGYGGAIYEQLHENEIMAVAHKGAAAAVQRTLDGQLRFMNVRTQVIWRFREALDPSQVGGSPIALPPSQALLADLTAPIFWLNPGGVLQVEPKEDVCARLGRSTDEGDAVVMAWSAGPTYVTDGDAWREAAAMKKPLGRRPAVIMSTGPRLTGRR